MIVGSALEGSEPPVPTSVLLSTHLSIPVSSPALSLLHRDLNPACSFSPACTLQSPAQYSTCFPWVGSQNGSEHTHCQKMGFCGSGGEPSFSPSSQHIAIPRPDRPTEVRTFTFYLSNIGKDSPQGSFDCIQQYVSR